MIVALFPRSCNRCSSVRRHIGVAFALGLGMLSSNSLAQPSTLLELSWEAPPHCPQRVDVERQLRLLLGDAARNVQQPTVRARGVVVPKDERFELTLLITEGNSTGQRVIASDDCSNLDRAAAIVLGLLLRQRQGLVTGSASQDATGSVVTPPSVPPLGAPGEEKPAAAPDAETAPKRTWRPFLRLPVLAVDVWTLPKANLGIGLAVGLRHAHWQGSIAGMLWKQQTKEDSSGLAYEATFRRQSLEAWTCRGWSSRGFEAAPCLMLALDHLSARASGDRLKAQQREAFPISVGTGLVGYWHLGQWGSLVVGATGRVMTSRPEFLVKGLIDNEQAHRLPWATVVGTIAYECIF